MRLSIRSKYSLFPVVPDLALSRRSQVMPLYPDAIHSVISLTTASSPCLAVLSLAMLTRLFKPVSVIGVPCSRLETIQSASFSATL
nr:MAG TPA: hypothetical protein [Caudoviricetes sp.]